MLPVTNRYLWPPYMEQGRPLYFHPVVLSSFFLSSFFLAYSQPLQIGWLQYFHTWCGLSANLGCRSETCCQKFAICATTQKLSGYVFATKARIDNRKKNLLHSNISPACTAHQQLRLVCQFGAFQQISTVSCLGFVTAATSLNSSQPNFARCLAVSWAGTLCVHFRGLLPRYGILPRTKFTLCASLVLSYIGSVTAWHSSSGRQPNFAVLSRGHYLYSAGWPSRCALAHSFISYFVIWFSCFHQHQSTTWWQNSIALILMEL